MPRRSTGPKLWFDNTRETWSIVDGKRKIRTGYGAADVAKAEQALAEYLGRKHTVQDSPEPSVADVLIAYVREQLDGKVSASHISYDIDQLERWWGDKLVRDINAGNCRAYTAHRKAEAERRAIEREVKRARREKRQPDIAEAKASAPSASTSARRELSFLRAALAHWNSEHGPLRFMPAIKLPAAPEARTLARIGTASTQFASSTIFRSIRPGSA